MYSSTASYCAPSCTFLHVVATLTRCSAGWYQNIQSQYLYWHVVSGINYQLVSQQLNLAIIAWSYLPIIANVACLYCQTEVPQFQNPGSLWLCVAVKLEVLGEHKALIAYIAGYCTNIELLPSPTHMLPVVTCKVIHSPWVLGSHSLACNHALAG